jgi:hypothetical protein
MSLPPGAAASFGFMARRWRGEVPWPLLFWRDMLLVATVVNVAATFAALMLASQGAPGWVAVLVHFLPVPYNALLFGALWRLPRRPWLVALAGGVWLVVMTVV